MISSQNINDLTEKLSNLIPESLSTLKSDAENNIKAILESSLEHMNLVSREEFDIQSALLQSTLAKLKRLEQRLEDLEQK